MAWVVQVTPHGAEDEGPDVIGPFETQGEALRFADVQGGGLYALVLVGPLTAPWELVQEGQKARIG